MIPNKDEDGKITYKYEDLDKGCGNWVVWLLNHALETLNAFPMTD